MILKNYDVGKEDGWGVGGRKISLWYDGNILHRMKRHKRKQIINQWRLLITIDKS